MREQKHLTEEHKAKLRKPRTAAQRKAISDGMKGKKKSVEHRRNMSISQTARREREALEKMTEAFLQPDGV